MIDASYVRGFFDGEGCVSYSERLRRGKRVGDSPFWGVYCHLDFTNTSLSLLLSIRDWLQEQGYHPKLRKCPRSDRPDETPYYILSLHRPDEIIRFFEEIGTNHPDKRAKFEEVKSHYRIRRRGTTSKREAQRVVTEMLKQSKPMF